MFWTTKEVLITLSLICCCLVPQLCLTLCDPMNYSLLGSSVHGILQTRILVWVAISFSRESSWLGDRTQVFCIGRQILYLCVTLTSSLIERWFVWRSEGSGLSNMAPLVYTHTYVGTCYLHTCGYTYSMDTRTQNTCTQTYTHSPVTQTVKNLPVMWETQVPSLGQEDHLEKGMSAHSCILVWRIPWIGEPGGLQSMGLQRVGHSSTTNSFTSLSCTI